MGWKGPGGRFLRGGTGSGGSGLEMRIAGGHDAPADRRGIRRSGGVPGPGGQGRIDPGRGFRIQGVLDFSLIGILSKISGILADNKIGIFAVSTYNTDYILVKSENFGRAIDALRKEGYTIV